MAIKKLSLRRKADDENQEAGEEQAEAPKKTLLKKAVAAPVEEEEAGAPKKVLVKKRLGGGPVQEEDAVEEGASEVVDEPAPKKVLKNVVDEDGQNEVDEADEPDEAPKKKALVKREATEAAVPADVDDRAPVVYQAMSMGAIDGPIDAKDLNRPRIQMVQANSADLEEKGFSTGQIVLGSELLIWEKGFDPLKAILMTGRKKFQQKLSDEEYKDGVIPLIFDGPEQAAEAGLTTEWDGDEPPTVDPVLFTVMLLEQPDYIEPDPAFNLEYKDRAFALAEMRFSGVNYRSTTSGKWLITQSRSSLAPDTRLSLLALSASREKQKKSGNIVTVASFKNLGKHKDADFRDWVLSLG